MWEQYNQRVEEGEKSEKVLQELGLERYCCKAMFLGQVDAIDEVSKFKKS